jgi:hypothetical protein
MAVSTFEGTVKNGQIRLLDDVKLPEHAKVYVIIPDQETRRPSRIYSPHLVHPEQAADFTKQIIEVATDAEL